MTPFSEHTIDRVETHKVDRHYPRVLGCNSRSGPHGRHAKITARIVRTDQGASGWGICEGPEEVVQRLVSRSLADVFSMETGVVPEFQILDRALHDLAAKILSQPVWRMLGAVGGQSVPVYSGAIYFEDFGPSGEDLGIDAVLDACRHDAGLGYSHFKLKVGRGFRMMDRAAGDTRDIEVTRRVREHFPDAWLLVDGNDGYEAKGACQYVEQVADCGLYWVEELFQETKPGLRMLRSVVEEHSPGTLIADAESRNGRDQDPPGLFGRWQAEHLEELYGWCREGLLDLLLMDVGSMGFSAWRRVMPRLLELGAQGSPHAWGEPMKTYYAAQIACGLGNVPIVEGVPGTVDGVDDSGYVLHDGVLTLPDSPGFGLDLHL